MEYTEILRKAIKIVFDEFMTKTDKGGVPYVMHCFAVMNNVKHLGSKMATIAVLHDLLEDCKTWSAARLSKEGFPDDVIAMITTLTKQKTETYESYISRISYYPKARIIKIADLLHNMDITRLPNLDEKAMERIKKYHKAYRFLINSRR